MKCLLKNINNNKFGVLSDNSNVKTFQHSGDLGYLSTAVNTASLGVTLVIKQYNQYSLPGCELG